MHVPQAISGDYTVREASVALPLNEQTVYRKVKYGEIPHYRDERGRIFIPREYIKSQRENHVADATMAYVEKVLADAPPLTADQRSRLAVLLAGGESDG